MCFRPPTAQIDGNPDGAPAIPGVPGAPGAPKAPGVPAVPGAPKAAPGAPAEMEGHDAAFMGDAPGADKQSCIPTLKVGQEAKININIPLPPK